MLFFGVSVRGRSHAKIEKASYDKSQSQNVVQYPLVATKHRRKLLSNGKRRSFLMKKLANDDLGFSGFAIWNCSKTRRTYRFWTP